MGYGIGRGSIIFNSVERRRYGKEILKPHFLMVEECFFVFGGNKDLEGSQAAIKSKEDKHELKEEMKNGNRNSINTIPLVELVFI